MDAVSPSTRSRALAGGALLLAATVLAYGPALGAGYVWDDEVFLRSNPLILAPDGLSRIWLSREGTDYFPLTSTMFWLEWRLWGDRPALYHAGNILLHALSAVLLWRLLHRLKVPGALLAGLVFAVHPVAVSSVAWISERKNTLSMALLLLSLLAYVRFGQESRRGWYFGSLAMFALALLAKTSVVMMPVALLVLAWWQGGAIRRRDLFRAMPFFGLSLALGLVTVWFQYHRAIGLDSLGALPWSARIANLGAMVWFYLYKLVVPMDLAMIYPRWEARGDFVSFLPLAGLAGVLAVLWLLRKRLGRGPLAGLLYYVVMLLPVLGLVQMSFHAYSWVADHFQYVAMPGVVALLAGGATVLAGRVSPRGVSWAAAVSFACLLGVLTARQASLYRDGEALWRHTLGLNAECWAARNSLGVNLLNKGRPAEAIVEFDKALAARPGFYLAYIGRSGARLAQGRFAEALADSSESLRLQERPEGYLSRALAKAGLGQWPAALADCDRALAINPLYAEAHSNRGNVLRHMDRLEEAIREYDAAIALRPRTAELRFNRGTVHLLLDRYDPAVADFTEAVAIRPDYGAAYSNRAVCHLRRGQFDRAWADVQNCRRVGFAVHPLFLADLERASGRRE